MYKERPVTMIKMVYEQAEDQQFPAWGFPLEKLLVFDLPFRKLTGHSAFLNSLSCRLS
jgi:hypothetical protein